MPEGEKPERTKERELSAIPHLRSAELFGVSNRIVIEHAGQEYVLLITRNGRLVLNRWH